MKTVDINLLLDGTQVLDSSMLNPLKSLVNEHPYFQVGIFAYLKCLYLYDEDSFKTELHRLSIFSSDRKALFYYILSEQFEQFFNHKRGEFSDNRTDILLNAFFETLDDSTIEYQLEHSLTHSSMASLDYFSYLNLTHETIEIDNENPEIKMKHQGIIDNFINNSGERPKIEFNLSGEDLSETNNLSESLPDEQSTELDDDLFFTETLAHIYIKQKKYTRAYEIIKRLSLNYPEKNIYFASQLSFLEKLIINSKNKK